MRQNLSKSLLSWWKSVHCLSSSVSTRLGPSLVVFYLLQGGPGAQGDAGTPGENGDMVGDFVLVFTQPRPRGRKQTYIRNKVCSLLTERSFVCLCLFWLVLLLFSCVFFLRIQMYVLCHFICMFMYVLSFLPRLFLLLFLRVKKETVDLLARQDMREKWQVN